MTVPAVRHVAQADSARERVFLVNVWEIERGPRPGPKTECPAFRVRASRLSVAERRVRDEFRRRGRKIYSLDHSTDGRIVVVIYRGTHIGGSDRHAGREHVAAMHRARRQKTRRLADEARILQESQRSGLVWLERSPHRAMSAPLGIAAPGTSEDSDAVRRRRARHEDQAVQRAAAATRQRARAEHKQDTELLRKRADADRRRKARED